MRNRSFNTFLVFLVAFVAASSIGTRADTYPRQPGIDAQHYVFRLTLLKDDSNEIDGEATVRLRVLRDDVREAVLDLASATPEGKGMTVTRVSASDQPVAFVHRDNRLRLPLPAGARPGNEVSFTIAYHGVAANGLRLLNNIHGERTA